MYDLFEEKLKSPFLLEISQTGPLLKLHLIIKHRFTYPSLCILNI